MYEFLDDPEFRKCVEEKKPYRFKNLGLKLFTWDDVFNEMTIKANQNFDFQVRSNFAIMFEYANRMPGVKPFLDHLYEISSNLWTAHCFISLTEKSDSYGVHRDNADVLFWQVIGRSRWDINGKVYILDPNDAIWVPRMVYHEVTPLGPRVGISFGMEYKEYVDDYIFQGRRDLNTP